jgi:hypothetical protein
MNTQDIARQFKRNAVVVLPVLWAVADAFAQEPSWEQAVPIVIGVVLRQFFTSPTGERDDREQTLLTDLDDMSEDLIAAASSEVDLAKKLREQSFDASAALGHLRRGNYDTATLILKDLV